MKVASGSCVARYYDPRTSVWQSADPILGQYLDGKPAGGVYFSRNLGLYGYAGLNPILYKDPNGKVIGIAIMTIAVLILSNIETANAPGPDDVATNETTSLVPTDLAFEALKEVTPESTHTAIDVVSVIGNPTKAITKADDVVSGIVEGAGRGTNRNPNKLSPVEGAEGPHTSFRRDADGNVSNYETYDLNPATGEFGASKRFRGSGKVHGGVKPPLILERPLGADGLPKGPGARPNVPRKPTPSELPKGYDE